MALFGFGNTTPPADPTPELGDPPPGANPTPDPTPEPKGLDKFAKLLYNDTDDKSQKDQKDEKLIFDPTAILEDEEATAALLSKLDFSQAISKETQQKLQANEPDAILALVNDVGKQAYLQSLKHTSALMKRHIDDRLQEQDGHVSNKIHSSIKSADLESKIPEIANPIVALGVKPFIDKLQAQNPSISSDEVVTQVRAYLKELNLKLNAPDDTPNPRTPKEIDWLDELGL